MKTIRLGRYPYTFARVSAMKGKLIGREQYLKLLKMTPQEITKFLQETEYKQQIDELAVSYSGVDLIERALNQNLTETFDKLRRISDEQVKILIDTYLKRWDIHDVKTVLRGIVNRADKEHVRSLLLAAGTLRKEALMKLFELNDVAEVLTSLPFIPQNRFEQKKDLFEIENELDKLYYEDVLALSKNVTGYGMPFGRFLRSEIDILNLKTVLRLKQKGFDKKEILNYMVFSGNFLGPRLIEKLATADRGQIAEVLADTPYAAAIHDSLIDTELELDKLLIHRSFLSVHQMPLTITAILSYLLVKEIEVRNIKTIVKAKQLGIEEKFIEERLVV